MIDYKEVIDLYRNLDLDDKRNELNILLQKIDALLVELLNKNNINDVKEYKSISDEVKEDDLLVSFYEDLINIKNKILILLSIEMNDKE